MMLPTISDVQTAAERIAGHVRTTPLLSMAGSGLRLKREDLQITGSFKLRGAANYLTANKPVGVVASSSGNHGLAVASLARDFGIPAVVVMTSDASRQKMALIEEFGAEIVLVDGGTVPRNEAARAIAAHRRADLIHPSDDFHVIAGQGTVGLELAQDRPTARRIYVPVGGGGLLAGLCLAREAWRSPPEIIGVEPAGFPRYRISLQHGTATDVPMSTTIADGLRSQTAGRICLPIVMGRVSRMLVVSDEEILLALDRLMGDGVAAEPSGAVAVAAALREGAGGDAIAIVSGGNGSGRGWS